MIAPANYFKCLADETRLRCMTLLHEKGELCVCELTQTLDLSQPKISRHLAQLRQCGLLLDSRKGQWVYYKVNPALPDWAMAILNAASTAAETQERYQLDRLKLQLITNNSEENKCYG